MRAFLNPPDHLTRTARELARWDDAVALAAGAAISGHVHVIRVQAAGPGRIAFLTDPTTADAAADSIAGMVDRVRAPK